MCVDPALWKQYGLNHQPVATPATMTPWRISF
jgi:hypothetical protein